MRTKYFIIGNILIDFAAVLYFVYTYFIQKVIISENGERLTNYQFWGLNQRKIIFHYARLPFILIVTAFTVTIIILIIDKIKHHKQ